MQYKNNETYNKVQAIYLIKTLSLREFHLAHHKHYNTRETLKVEKMGICSKHRYNALKRILLCTSSFMYMAVLKVLHTQFLLNYD